MSPLKKQGKIHPTLTGFDFRVDKSLGTRKAIRMKCRECQCGNDAEVRRCHVYDCSLWTWRFGRRLKPEDIVQAQASKDAQARV